MVHFSAVEQFEAVDFVVAAVVLSASVAAASGVNVYAAWAVVVVDVVDVVALERCALNVPVTHAFAQSAV